MKILVLSKAISGLSGGLIDTPFLSAELFQTLRGKGKKRIGQEFEPGRHAGNSSQHLDQ
jgi:hypothetical protein